MRYSRSGIIAILVAVEVFLAGAIVWSVSGHGFTVHAAGLHRSDIGGKSFAAIDAGSTPHVTIDDAISGVTVTPSSDGKVHVSDRSFARGLIWGTTPRPPLQVARTADGVRVERIGERHGLHIAIFGIDREQIEVAVPQASLLEIRRCSGADVSGLSGRVSIHSVDGHIEAANLRVSELALTSENGSIRLNDVAAPAIGAWTKDGSIRASALQVGGGNVHTEDGSVTLDLRDANLTVHAHTADGSVRFNGRRAASSSDESSGDLQLGMGGGSLQVSTQDGSIHIASNGAQ